MRRFNDWLALKVTAGVASMWCAYAFTALALVSLPATLRTGNLTAIVAWVAQTFLQLVLLSIILVGQQLQSLQAAAHHEEAKALHVHHRALLHRLLGEAPTPAAPGDPTP